MSDPETHPPANVIPYARYFHSLKIRRCATCGEPIDPGCGAVADYDRRECHHVGCAVPDVRRAGK